MGYSFKKIIGIFKFFLEFVIVFFCRYRRVVLGVINWEGFFSKGFVVSVLKFILKCFL